MPGGSVAGQAAAFCRTGGFAAGAALDPGGAGEDGAELGACCTTTTRGPAGLAVAVSCDASGTRPSETRSRKQRGKRSRVGLGLHGSTGFCARTDPGAKFLAFAAGTAPNLRFRPRRPGPGKSTCARSRSPRHHFADRLFLAAADVQQTQFMHATGVRKLQHLVNVRMSGRGIGRRVTLVNEHVRALIEPARGRARSAVAAVANAFSLGPRSAPKGFSPSVRSAHCGARARRARGACLRPARASRSDNTWRADTNPDSRARAAFSASRPRPDRRRLGAAASGPLHASRAAARATRSCGRRGDA